MASANWAIRLEESFRSRCTCSRVPVPRPRESLPWTALYRAAVQGSWRESRFRSPPSTLTSRNTAERRCSTFLTEARNSRELGRLKHRGVLDHGERTPRKSSPQRHANQLAYGGCSCCPRVSVMKSAHWCGRTWRDSSAATSSLSSAPQSVRRQLHELARYLLPASDSQGPSLGGEGRGRRFE